MASSKEHGRKPVIALVGRPNVGKSTLFNRLAGRRAAIVEDLPGVTRDRHYADGEMLGREFMVIDTGGFEPVTDDRMLQLMRDQAQLAIEEADVVVCLFDGREGLLPADEEIARMLQRSGKPVHWAVNKIDGPRHEPLVAEFWALGVPELFGLSAQHGEGVLDLMEAVVEDLPELEAVEASPANVTAVAIVGKPNAGKSTLVNRLLGQERLLTSDEPGTTRDSIDTWLERPADPAAIEAAEAALAELEVELEVDEDGAEDGTEDDAWDDEAIEDADGPEVIHGEGRQIYYAFEPPADVMARWEAEQEAQAREPELEQLRAQRQAELEQAKLPRRYLVIDTAGVRRRKWVKTRLEKYSIVRSFKSIDRAEVCLMLIDATEGVTDQDAKLAGLVQAKGKACILLVNKWDIVPGKDTYTAGAFAKKLRGDLHFVDYAPILFVSARTGQRLHRLFGLIDQVKRNWERRIPTGELNRFLQRCLERHQPPIHKGRRVKVYYASQVASGPPTILLSVNDRNAMHFSYERYLLNRVRERWDFEGTPVRFVYRSRTRRK